MGTVQLSPPTAPFQKIKNPGESITIKTAGKVLVLPTGNSILLPSFNEYALNSNRLTIAESPFGGLKGSGAADYAVGTLYVNSGDGIYLTDKNGNNSTKTLTAGKLKEVSSLTVDSSAKTITEEFILSNTNAPGSVSIVDDCSVTTGWTKAYVNDGTITSDGSSITFTETSEAGTTRIGIQKNFNVVIGDNKFICFKATCDVSCRLRFLVYGVTGTATWMDDFRFALSAGVESTFVLPLFAPAGTSGQNPNSSTITGTTITKILIGAGWATAGMRTMTIKPITLDVGKTATVELQIPDSLNVDSSLQVQAWDGSAYQICGNYKLDSSYVYVSGTAANWKLNDATKLDDVYGSGLGRALFPKSISAATVNGSTGTLTYSGNKGTSRRIGIKIDLPPSDSGRTNFNKIRLKTILTYANSGATSYEFVDSTNASYGLQNLVKPWIALYDPAGNYIDFFLFTHRPKNLVRKRDDSGEIYELTLYPGNGSIYRGRITNALLTTDSDSNLIPDCLESSIEGSVTKFLSSYGMVI